MLKPLLFALEILLAGCAAPDAVQQEADKPKAPAEVPVPAPPAAASAPKPPAPPADPAVRAELERLAARAAELEKELNVTPPADVRTMLDMIPRGEAAAFSREIEKHLLRGEAGHAVLNELFLQSDVEHEKIDILTHHPQFIYAILRVVGLYPNETAAASRHLIKATKEQPESWVRRELFNFIPVFILHHRGRYPELRRDFEEDIVYQIQVGGAFLYKVSLAMRDLEFRPPAEIFLPLLLDSQKREMHGMVVEYLVSRKEEGLPVFLRYLDESKDYKLPTTGAVLGAIQTLERGQGGDRFARLLEHQDADLRRAATFVYFGEPRDETELPRLIEILNSAGVTAAQKRALISVVAQKSPELFKLVFDQADVNLTDPSAKTQVQRTAEAIARRKAKKAAEPLPVTPAESTKEQSTSEGTKKEVSP